MDEVHCQKGVNYPNGKFFGLENNEVSKTLLCLMIKSVSGKYRDVISMTSIANINDEKLYSAWDNSVKVHTSIGFDAIVVMTDGHLSHLKLFTWLLNVGDNHFSISNPYFLDKKIFLLFGTVHLFKNIYNNFLKYLIFEYPTFPVKDSSIQVNNDETTLANSGHIKQLYYLELGKPMKMAHKLIDKVLNPSPLEKNKC